MQKNIKILSIKATLFAMSLLAFGCTKSKEEKIQLSVYTAAEVELMDKYKTAFESKNPDIEIKWVRNSTGVITSKLLAEKSNRQADAVWAIAATSLNVLKDNNMLLPYAPNGIEKINPKMKDTATPPNWVGQLAWVGGLCINTKEMAAKNLPMPTKWADLQKDIYKGHIVMPNPMSSGTGFLDVTAWLQLFGGKRAWAYMDALHKNIAYYTHSGSKPCKLAGRGEIPIGVSFIYRGVSLAKKGAPVKVITPSEGLGWELEAAGILKGTKKLEAAQRLIDWAVSDEAAQIYNSAYAVIARGDIAKKIEGYPEDIEAQMVSNDFDMISSQRKFILAKWKKRYDRKSEKK